MRNILSMIKLLIFALSFEIFIGCSKDSEKATIKYLSYQDGGRRVEGTSLNDKKNGFFNYYDSDGIQKTEYYRNDTIQFAYLYYEGLKSILESYQVGNYTYSTVDSLSVYLKSIGLDQLKYSRSEPSIEFGRRIFELKCYGCHNFDYGYEFVDYYNLTETNFNDKIKSAKLDTLNNRILIKSSLDNPHYIFGFLSDQDVESLGKFLSSTTGVREYKN